MRVIAIITILLSITEAFAGQDYIRRFAGRWAGAYQVSTLEGRTIADYPIEKVYYWIDEQLWGETAVKLPDGSIEIEFSSVRSMDGHLRAEVEGNLGIRRYVGWMRGNRLWWMNALETPAPHHQLYREHLQPTPDGFEWILQGYQWSPDPSRPEFARIHARLKRMDDDESFQLFGAPESRDPLDD